MNFIQNLNWTIHRWPVQQNLRRHGVVWSRTEVRRWTTRRCQGRCATIMAVNAREGKDTWQWWKRNDFITSGWFFSSISFSNLMFVWIFCLFNCNIWWIIKFDRLISFFNGFIWIAQVWGARSKLERGGGGPNEAAVQPASALQVHILYWFIPFLLVDIFYAPSILFAGATSVFGQKNSRRWALSRVDSQEPYFKKSYPPFDLKPSDENELVQNFESLTQMPNCPIQVANISLPLSSIQSMHCNDHNIRIFLLRKSLAASSSQCRLDISTLVSYQT